MEESELLKIPMDKQRYALIEELEIYKEAYQRTADALQERNYPEELTNTFKKAADEYRDYLYEANNNERIDITITKAFFSRISIKVALEKLDVCADDINAIMEPVIEDILMSREAEAFRPRRSNFDILDKLSFSIDNSTDMIFGASNKAIPEEEYLEEYDKPRSFVGADKTTTSTIGLTRRGYYEVGNIPSNEEEDPLCNKEFQAKFDLVDRRCHDLIGSYLAKGYTEVSLNGILKSIGYKNVNSNGMIETKKTFYTSILKLRNTDGYLDATEEAKALSKSKKGHRKIEKAVIQSAFLNCDIEAVAYRDGNFDLIIQPRLKAGEKPIDAIPFYAYAKSKNRMTTSTSDDYKFKKAGRIKGFEMHVVWSEVLSHSRTKYKNGTPLYFDDLFEGARLNNQFKQELNEISDKNQKELDRIKTIEDPREREREFKKIMKANKKAVSECRRKQNQRRYRYINKLEKMLEERQEEGKLKFKIDEKRTYLIVESTEEQDQLEQKQ